MLMYSFLQSVANDNNYYDNKTQNQMKLNNLFSKKYQAVQNSTYDSIGTF